MEIIVRPYIDADFDVVTSIWLNSWNSNGVVTQTVTLAALRERLPREIARGWVKLMDMADIARLVDEANPPKKRGRYKKAQNGV